MYMHFFFSFYLGPLAISVFITVKRYLRKIRASSSSDMPRSIKGNGGLIGVHAIDWGCSRITRQSGTFDTSESRIVQLPPATQ